MPRVRVHALLAPCGPAHPLSPTGGEWQRELNVSNPLGSGGQIAEEYVALLRMLWQGSAPAVAPTSMKRAIARSSPQFEGYQQHDAQELAGFLLDGLHEDLNRLVGKKSVSR